MAGQPRLVTVTLNAAIDKRYQVDSFAIGDVARVQECVYSAGGKGLNVSRTAHLLGAEVLAAGFLGGFAGEFIAQEVTKEGVFDRFLRVEGESRSCVNIIDAHGTHSELLEPGFTVTDDDLLEFEGGLRELCSQVDVCVLSGSLPVGCGPDTYARLIALIHAAGCRAFLDTSGIALEAALSASPDFIKPNRQELSALLGREIESEDQAIAAAAELADRFGVGTVAVSLGPAGAIAVSAEKSWIVRAPDVPVKNTVGCGDAFVGAYAVATVEQRETEACLRQAVAVSSASSMCEDTGAFLPEDLRTVLSLM